MTLLSLNELFDNKLSSGGFYKDMARTALV